MAPGYNQTVLTPTPSWQLPVTVHRLRSPHGTWLQPNCVHSISFVATIIHRLKSSHGTCYNQTVLTPFPSWQLPVTEHQLKSSHSTWLQPNCVHSISFMVTINHRLKSSHGTWLQPNHAHFISFMATTSNSASTEELPQHLVTTKVCSLHLLHGNYQSSTEELPRHLNTTKPCSLHLLHGNYQLQNID